MSEKGREPERGPARRLRFKDEARDGVTSGQVGPKLKKRFPVPKAPEPPPIPDGPDASPPVEDTPVTSGHVGPKLAPEHKPTGKAASRRLRFKDEAGPGASPVGDNPTTSGQHGPKLKQRGKLRQDSEKARPSERLRREGEPPPPDDRGPASSDKAGAAPKSDKKTKREDKRYEKSGHKADKSGAKLNNAREKLAAQKPLKKPGIVKNLGRAAKFEARRFVHGKIHEVERENVGVEAAHKTELVGEKAVRGTARLVKRRIRTRPARRVRKWEKKNIKARADYQFRTMVQENPELKKNALSRFWQKRRIKKQYQKQAREAAKQGARAAKKTAVTTEKIAAAVWRFVKNNPKIVLIAACLLLLIIVLQSCMAALTTIGNGVIGAVGGTSYLAEDADIDEAELRYTEWETDLQLEINNAESTHPGFDEYRYNVDDISHNPYELMAFLTAVYDDFTYSGVHGVLQQIFNEQYTLEFIEEVEVRSYTETDTWTDDEGNTHTDTYTVYYNYYILNINLTARSFTDVIFPRMNAEQLERYNIYMITKGNRQYLSSPFGDFNWLPYVTSYYGYRVHPTSGAKDYHMGADIGLPEGTEILAGQDGTVTFAGNSGDYGLVVVLDNGEGLVSKYAHCSILLVSAGQTVKAGDVIAKVGNTGNSTGPHLHLEIIKDGRYLNPLYFAVTNDYNSGPTYGADPGAVMGDGSYAALIAEAELHLGKPYVWGASGPNSFDCSGYVCYVLNHSGVASVGRTTAQGLYNLCTPISQSEAQPGDLIFFQGTYSTSSTVTHVAIYTGGNMMIHAGKPVKYASFNTTYWQNHFYSFGRLP